ncbi:hypothetical protein ABT095_26905 [Kitasatospora sp. NPDC002227]|uniref:hypothetical protein n=1 Tax=Kitasatospora sp. NPDC002227 TaxID=3154773 RepID=UPI00332BF656
MKKPYSYWRVVGGTMVEVDHSTASGAWTREVYPALVEVARTYHAVITYGALGQVLQERSGVFTRVPPFFWIGQVLGSVVREAHLRGDPQLTALVVRVDDGMVGDGYDEVLQVSGLPPAADDLARENHAAEARLACYRRFCSSLPADGGTAALAPRLQSAIARRRAASAAERPAPVCSRCFVQLPVTGVCDNCG